MGFLMTVLTQSSSAAIALTLTAATSGLLGIYAAGAMVIGANVGTTSTAVLSVIGATANAKRVAAAHVLFNGITGVIALLLLPVLFFIIDGIANLLDVEPVPSITLALFHTVFNILGVILMLPFTAKLANFLSRHFTSKDEILGQARYLDKTLASTPALALNAAVMELQHLSALAIQLCGKASSNTRRSQEIIALHDAVGKLVLTIAESVMSLQRSAISAEVAGALPKVLRANQYFHSAAELAIKCNQQGHITADIDDEKLKLLHAAYQKEIAGLLKLMDFDSNNFSARAVEEMTSQLKHHHDNYKESILQTSIEAELTPVTLSELLEYISSARRMMTQMSKAIMTVAALKALVDESYKVLANADAMLADD